MVTNVNSFLKSKNMPIQWFPLFSDDDIKCTTFTTQCVGEPQFWSKLYFKVINLLYFSSKYGVDKYQKMQNFTLISKILT
jgi:hypothetical protein